MEGILTQPLEGRILDRRKVFGLMTVRSLETNWGCTVEKRYVYVNIGYSNNPWGSIVHSMLFIIGFILLSRNIWRPKKLVGVIRNIGIQKVSCYRSIFPANLFCAAVLLLL